VGVRGDNDTFFLQLMIRHHQGGIEMAGYAAQHSTTTIVRQTAVSMIDEQAQDIRYMTILLKQRIAAPLPYP